MAFSELSRILKSCSISSLKKFSLTRPIQNESIVDTFAFGKRASCLCAFVLFWSLFIISSNFFAILLFISAAAALVKVTIRSLSTSTSRLTSVMSFITRSTKTAVLPDPAAALTRMLLLRASMAFCCGVVHLVIYIILL